MKNVIIFLFFLLTTVNANAAKAVGTVRNVQQPDGTVLSYCLLGDEHFHWTQTTDGVLIIWDNNAFCVGNVTGYGAITSSGIIAHNDSLRSADEKEAVDRQDKNRATFFTVPETVQSKAGNGSQSFVTYTSSTICPHSGTITVPVALVQYSDVCFKVGATYDGTDATAETLPTAEQVRASFESYFNNIDGDFKLGDNSVAKYFSDASNGNLRMVFELHGPFTLPHNHDYYGHKSSTHDKLYSDALKLLNDSIDFSEKRYDINGDGNVDMVTVLFAGGGANLTASGGGVDPNDSWPACYPGSYSASFNNVRIPVIGAFSELMKYPTKAGEVYTRAGIGVTCHELSHGLGMPDLYDTNTSIVRSNYSNNGPEWWDLMDGGENINSAKWPCQYLAWERDYFDWSKAVELKEPASITLTPCNEGGTAYKVVNPADPTEYYIIEAAQKKNWNEGLFRYFKSYVGSTVSGGLLVEHVSKTALTSLRPNNTYSEKTGYQPSLTLVPADGIIISQSSVDNVTYTAKDFIVSLAGDQYPGIQNVTSLSAYKNYKGDDMAGEYPVTDISRNDDGSISFKFMGGAADMITSGISGTCVWEIDSAGNMTVKPVDGVCGTLGAFDMYGGTPWYSYRDKIRTVNFVDTVKAQTCYKMFYGCTKLTSVNLSGLDNSDATSTESMFSDCNALERVYSTSATCPAINTSTFESLPEKSKCTLYVPASARADYAKADGWKELKVIGVEKGDVNLDQKVNVTDVAEIVNNVLGKSSASFVKYWSDVDGKDGITLDDVNALKGIIIKK